MPLHCSVRSILILPLQWVDVASDASATAAAIAHITVAVVADDDDVADVKGYHLYSAI